MRLEHSAPELNRHQGEIYRHSPMTDLVGFLGCAAMVGGAGFAAWKLWSSSIGFLWIAAGPILALTGGILLLLASAFAGTFRMSLKSSNWLVALEPSRVHLNLRSYRNGHFAGEHPTVLVLERSEIEQVSWHTELRQSDDLDGTETRRTRWIELALRNVDTAAIEAACRVERRTPAPTQRFAGVVSATKHHDVTLCVPGPNRLWVQAVAGLYDGLAEHYPTGIEQHSELEETYQSLSLEERTRALLARGERLDAIRLAAEELGLDTRDAKGWVQEIETRAA